MQYPGVAVDLGGAGQGGQPGVQPVQQPVDLVEHARVFDRQPGADPHPPGRGMGHVMKHRAPPIDTHKWTALPGAVTQPKPDRVESGLVTRDGPPATGGAPTAPQTLRTGYDKPS
ncbi:MAG TPA: hypothetical protein PLT68_05620, partial [Actinomycetota bacterium]|nr:hypothetical protein [Actinomycetota bacterium]